MSNAQKRTSEFPEVDHVLVKVDGKKRAEGFGRSGNSFRKTIKTRWAIGTSQIYLGHRWRLPLIFGFSVLIFAMTFIGLVLVLAGSQQSQAANDPHKKIVFIQREIPVETTAVLIPVRDIRKGERLEQSMFTLVERPKVAVPVTAVSNPDQIRGAFARSNLIHEQPVSLEMLQGAKPLNPVIASIQPGYRAVTINVNATSSVEGWATAGAYVDVQWVSEIRGQKTATLITQNAKILSAERQTDEKNVAAPVPTTITLLVSDRDAKKVSLASSTGQLILLLRGTEDMNKGIRSITLTLKDLYNVRTEAGTTGLLRYRDSSGAVQELSLVEGKIVQGSENS